MVRTVCGTLVVAVLAGLGVPGPAFAQAPSLPPTPVPVSPPAPGSAVPAAPPRTLPPGAVLGPPEATGVSPQTVPGGPAPGAPLGPPPPGPPPYIPPFQDRNGPLLRGDPLLDRPGTPPPGWFAGVDIALVAPHVKNALVAPVTVPGIGTADVHVGGAELDWTGSPSVSVGYRLAQGCGEFVATYRFLVSEGTDTIPDFDPLGAANLRSRLNLNVLDLDYVSREYSLGPWWDLNWRAGIRFAAFYYDSRALGLVMGERVSDNFIGAGPHLGFEVARHLEIPGLSVFAGLDGAGLIGHLHQAYEVTFTDGVNSIGGATNQSTTQFVPVLRFEVGLNWAPPGNDCYHFSVGYQFEQWWYLGQLNDARAQLTDQGVFFRTEFNF
jgi:hypothetical protein